MRTILYCNLPYAFAILKPLAEELARRHYDYVWYMPENIASSFPYLDTESNKLLHDIAKLYEYKAEAIFVPGNEVPWFLPGVKTQIFHGLAGEKKGHFRIRDYFDLYLTQGPYFTERFKELAKKHGDFEVVETGWAKLDRLFTGDDKKHLRESLFSNTFPNLQNDEKIILYAPTFSPSLTSATKLLQSLKNLSILPGYRVVVKFHDKMNPQLILKYEQLVDDNFTISSVDDITQLLQSSDAMVSDTSSVVYEFLLLGKPVVTYASTAELVIWEDIIDASTLVESVHEVLSSSYDLSEAIEFVKAYHPYQDGKSAERMLNAVESYIVKHGVPESRQLSLLRKFKTYKKYKFIPSWKAFF